MNNDKQQKPATVNQIEQEKPTIPKSIDNLLLGYFANSMNGGHNRTIFFKKVMAGERHKQFKVKLNMQLLTPLTPAYQNLKCTVRAYFVPNSRVWENAEKYTAQKGGNTTEKIAEIPNLQGKFIPQLEDNSTQDVYTFLSNTTLWRDSYISCYIPRTYIQNETTEQVIGYLPSLSILPLRGRIAIYNDFERNKEYDEEIFEYKSDTVTDEEWNSHLPTKTNIKMDIFQMRAKKENSYYTDYRTELQGFELPSPITDGLNENNELVNWAQWESKIAEARSQAENAQKNDWEIIAELRGTRAATQGKVQLIGQKTFNVNYSAITQSSYNNNEVITDDTFKVMGKQGAYSYTDIELPVYAGMEFIEEGYVHIIATVTADTVYESAFNRMELNITPLEEYRPDLLDDKKDVIYKAEYGTFNPEENYQVVGFKRKYSEYFKLNNIIAGDMNNYPWFDYATVSETDDRYTPTEYNGNYRVFTQKSYQFFEIGADGSIFLEQNEEAGNYGLKKEIWKDYTDLMINKNQAIQNKIQPLQYVIGNLPYKTEWVITGQNQIFFVGMAICVADLPIDDSIKKNYTTWGEH